MERPQSKLRLDKLPETCYPLFMLKLRKLTLSNFLSHGDTELDFKDGQKTLVDGKSGAGKSSIFDAVLWVLYGQGRASNVSLIKNGEKSAVVSLTLTDSKKFWTITRQITEKGKHGLSLDESDDGVEFKPAPIAGVKAIQEFIEKELLKASYPLFVNSVASPQDPVESFVDQTASRRKELLLEIAGSEKYDTYYERAKNRVALEKEALSRIEGQLAEKEKFASLSLEMQIKIEDL